jgi:hypothetical protein
MPARSEAQRRYLASRFGPAWMRKHGFANEGKLPAKVGTRNAQNDAVTKMLAAGHRKR